MANANAEHAPAAEQPESDGRGAFGQWVTRDGAWYASSFVFHMVLMCFLMLLSVSDPPRIEGEAPVFVDPGVEQEPSGLAKIDKFVIGKASVEPSELNVDTLGALVIDSGGVFQTDFGGEVPAFTPDGGRMPGRSATNQPTLGSLSEFSLKVVTSGHGAHGPRTLDTMPGVGSQAGGGKPGSDFQGRTTGANRVWGNISGKTRLTERAVGGALNWIARHQMPDGSWSLQRFQHQCKDKTCTYPGTHVSDSAATALALLPFLAAGQTHQTKGLYRRNIHAGLYWMLRQQDKNGDLSGRTKAMYAHGLATIMLCEVYGLTNDKSVGQAAQGAVDFIEKAQHPRTGGWRYTPGQEGDTSVVGWQVMALKSAQMAGLRVNARALDGAKTWLKTASAGKPRGLFAYTPESAPSPAMTAVGLLCSQYLGVRREDPVMVDGVKYLMRNMPNVQAHNIYYWYYATQVLHNLPGPDWDQWNRKMRRVLIETQCTEGCAEGSWDPAKPAKDSLADTGGRLLVTSLSALTLEVYYRYLPLYKLDSAAALKSSQPLSRSLAEKTSDQSVESAMAKLPSEAEREKKAAQAKPAAETPAAKQKEKRL